MFQSTPAPKDGQCERRMVRRGYDEGFNPRPPRRTGDADAYRRESLADNVSIHARPEGRAMPTRSGLPCSSQTVSIHTRPERRAMRKTSASITVFRLVSIHTRPERRAMRLNHFAPAPSYTVSIHTRPERRAMLPARRDHRLIRTVSIHTRPERRAMHSSRHRLNCCNVFQSTPAPKGGRCTLPRPQPQPN